VAGRPAQPVELTDVDHPETLEAKIRRLQQLAIHGRRALTALGEPDRTSLETEALTGLERELAAQEELVAECRRLDSNLPQTRQQWQDWLDNLPDKSRSAARLALGRLEAALREASRVEAEVQDRLGRMRDELRPRLERIQAGHRVLKAYAGARLNFPRLLDREG
jgi:ABC-type transporter Mla subunit MlaD